ncbi:type II toxin-antitoxin system death-on-curing family toxin, partial [Pseudomonas viridiflava]|uniref:type II toxin-antitoxin system death-on-curing family toxin n=1 Tax=Pseudomonas viridiflava TaxID=33069 RepID=UPI003C7167E4
LSVYLNDPLKWKEHSNPDHRARHERGVNIPVLQGALASVHDVIAYTGLDDIFEIAAKYTASIAQGHALPDANKRTGLAVGLEYLSLNDYEIT